MISGIYTVAFASWGSIFAGGATALALAIVMGLLGMALGFTVLTPKSDDPTSGLGVTFGFWSFFSILVSMAGGGFIAGLLAGQRGLEHGFLVWAVVTLVASAFSGIAISSAVKTIGAAAKSLGSGAAGVVGTIGKGAVQATSTAITQLADTVDLSVDIESVGEDVKAVLRDSGIDTLQPEYLKEQMRGARSDLRAALYQLSLHPANADQIITRFLENQKNRFASLAKEIDKDAVVETLMNKRDIPKEDAEVMVDNALTAYEQGLQKVKDVLAEVKAQLGDAKAYLKEIADTAREKADKLASATAKSALAAAIALILAAVISSGAGLCGAWYAPTIDVPQTFIVR